MALTHFRHPILQLAVNQAVRVLKAQARSIRLRLHRRLMVFSAFLHTFEMLSMILSTFEALDEAFSMVEPALVCPLDQSEQ